MTDKMKMIIGWVILAIVWIAIVVTMWGSNSADGTQFGDWNSWVQEIDMSKTIDTTVNEWNNSNEAKNDNKINFNVSQ